MNEFKLVLLELSKKAVRVFGFYGEFLPKLS